MSLSSNQQLSGQLSSGQLSEEFKSEKKMGPRRPRPELGQQRIMLEIDGSIKSVDDLHIHFMGAKGSQPDLGSTLPVVRLTTGDEKDDNSTTPPISFQLQQHFCQACKDGNVEEVKLVIDSITALGSLSEERKKGGKFRLTAEQATNIVNTLVRDTRVYDFHYSPPISLAV
jgi:hypothetical protein